MNSLPTSTVSLKALSTALLIVFVMVFGVSTAQAQSLTIGSVQACAASEVVVPVMGDDINNIGSITLFIAFNDTSILFKSVDNIDSQLSGINYSFNQNPLQLVFAWSSVAPIGFDKKKLFDLRFAFSGHSSLLAFGSGCEIANNKLEIISVKYTDGKISSGLPQIELQPKDTLIKPGASAKFIVNVTNADIFSWKESRDNGLTWQELKDNDKYYGTNTNELDVKSIPVSYSSYLYKCAINSQNCSIFSTDAKLTVDNQAGINNNLYSDYFDFNADPNPILTSTTLGFNLPDNGNVKILILDLSGKILYKVEESYYLKGCHTIDMDLSHFSKGIYVSKLMFTNTNTNRTTTLKLIKT